MADIVFSYSGQHGELFTGSAEGHTFLQKEASLTTRQNIGLTDRVTKAQFLEWLRPLIDAGIDVSQITPEFQNLNKRRSNMLSAFYQAQQEVIKEEAERPHAGHDSPQKRTVVSYDTLKKGSDYERVTLAFYREQAAKTIQAGFKRQRDSRKLWAHVEAATTDKKTLVQSYWDKRFEKIESQKLTEPTDDGFNQRIAQCIKENRLFYVSSDGRSQCQ